jgi:hypothetical protein
MFNSGTFNIFIITSKHVHALQQDLIYVRIRLCSISYYSLGNRISIPLRGAHRLCPHGPEYRDGQALL